MKIITERAEEGLLKRLKNGRSLCYSNYILHIRGVHFTKEDFDRMPQLVQGWIGDADGEILVCFDRDIFVLSANFSPRIFELIKNHFHTMFQYKDVEHKNVLSFYTIEDNLLGLIEVAETKLSKKTSYIKQKDKEAQEMRKIKTKENFKKIDLPVNLTSTVAKRRHERRGFEIMVVEDDIFTRKLLSGTLIDYNVTYVGDGHEALATYLQKAPDIMFLDIGLPDVSGHEVLSKILSFDLDAYVVMLSGHSQSEHIVAAMKAGAKGFVGKPFTREKLVQYIEKCPKFNQNKADVVS